MNREIEKISNEYNKVIVQCQSTTERDEHARTYPMDLPATHELHHEWLDDMRYAVYPRLRPELSTESETATQPQQSQALLAKAGAIKALNARRIEDLRTRAAELSIDVPTNATKPQVVAAIVSKIHPE